MKLNANIGLDASETEVDPQNPNPRGAFGSDSDKGPLDFIVQSFNQRWFQGWDEAPDYQKITFKKFAQHFQSIPDFEAKFLNNPDVQTKEIAFQKMFDEVINKNRKSELTLYKLLAKDDSFRIAFQDTLKRFLSAQ